MVMAMVMMVCASNIVTQSSPVARVWSTYLSWFVTTGGRTRGRKRGRDASASGERRRLAFSNRVVTLDSFSLDTRHVTREQETPTEGFLSRL